MTRDETILKMIPIVKNIVIKLNRHIVDEDLISIGTISVIEGVDSFFKKGIYDFERIKASCILRITYAILNYNKKRNLQYNHQDVEWNANVENLMDVTLDLESDIIIDLDTILTKKEFDLLSEYLTDGNIENILIKNNISKRTFQGRLKNIRDKIRNYQKN